MRHNNVLKKMLKEDKQKRKLIVELNKIGSIESKQREKKKLSV